jgi:hypothetical protein
VTFIVPYFIKRIPYVLRVSVSVLNGIIGFVVVVYAEEVKWKLVGVGIISLGTAVNEISFLGLMSYFDSTAVSAFSTGSGVGLFGSPLYYIGKHN